MKKVLVIILCCCLLVGCSKTDPAAQKIIDDINSIGTVGLEDEALIDKLIERYKDLTDNQKEQVSNYVILLEAEEQLEELRNPIRGNYKSENGLLMAHVDSSSISLYRTIDDGKVWTLYWKGSYKDPEEISGKYEWTSQSLLGDDYYPLMLINKSIKITYEDDSLSVPDYDETFFYMRVDKINEVIKDCKEDEITNNENEVIKIGELNIKAPNVFQLLKKETDMYEYVAPRSALACTCAKVEGVTDKYLDYYKSNLKVDSYTIEPIKVKSLNGILIKGELDIVGKCKFYNVCCVDPINENVMVFTLGTPLETEYDYYGEFLKMLESAY